MISAGNKKRILISGWFLVGVILLAYNGFQFMNIFAPSVEGYSGKVKELKMKLPRLEQYNDKTVESTSSHIDDILSLYLQKTKKYTSQITGIISKENKNKKEEITLPKIEGIIRAFDINGNVRLYVIIDGRSFGVGDKVNEFRIQDIKYDSVTITKGSKSWDIPAPEVSYTLANIP